MQSYNNTRNCDFSDGIVSYLYGETNHAEKSVFESHLAKCPTCADELAAFSEVHFAVENWRVSEFDILPTPQIIIPYHESPIQRGFVQTVEPISMSGWRQIFNFSFAWKSAMAMAVLAVFGFVILFAVKFNKSDQIAAVELPVVNNAVNSLPTKVATEETPTISPSIREVNTKSTPVKNQIKPLLAVSPQPYAKSVKNPKTYEAVVKLPKTSGIKQLPVETVAGNSYKTPKSPRLATDDEDRGDDSLRLAELFDETDEIN